MTEPSPNGSSGPSENSSFGRARPLPGSYRMAAVQMASGPQVDANLSEAGRLIAMAAEQGATLIGLPEYFGLMGLRDQDKVDAAEIPGQGPMQDFLARTARRHRVWLVGGSVPLRSAVPGKVRNACLVYDDQGNVRARYDKMHLFGFQRGEETYNEARTIEPGEQVVAIDTPFGRLGLSICYDLRFPELYRAMAGVDVICAPSAFTETTGRAHWETLIRARAVENLAYVMAPAQGGYHISGRETHGSTMIVDPWGVILDVLPRGSGTVVAGVNPAHQATVRESLPALRHRVLPVGGAPAPGN